MSDSETETPAIVIENGSVTIKAGFAGDDVPRLTEPSMVKHSVRNSIGYAALRYNGQCYDPSQIRSRSTTKYDIQNHPVQQGVVVHWDKMEVVWQNIFKQLKVNASEHAVLLTEIPLNPKANREKMTQLMFETFNAPQFYVSIDCVLALYASGRTTGIVVNSGFDITNIVPIYEGYCLPHAVQRLNVAGKQITTHLMHTHSISFESANCIKEKFCGLAHKAKQYVIYDQSKGQKDAVIHTFQSTFVAEIAKQSLLSSNENIAMKEIFVDRNLDTSEPIEYELPDGQTIQIGNERFRAPEILFEPTFYDHEEDCIHKLTVKSINKCDIDIRKDLYDNIVMTGGSTLFDGMRQRFTAEMCKIVSDAEIKVIAPPERLNSVWIGGSIVSSLSTFEEMWIEKEEYDESGPSIVHRKCT